MGGRAADSARTSSTAGGPMGPVLAHVGYTEVELVRGGGGTSGWLMACWVVPGTWGSQRSVLLLQHGTASA
jgi:hypothetical protein